LLYKQEDIKRLAVVIINDCFQLKENDVVVIEGMDVPSATLQTFAEVVSGEGFKPYIIFKSSALLLSNNNLENGEFVKAQAHYELSIMKQAQALIGLREIHNSFELSKLTPRSRQQVLHHYIKPVHFEYRNNNLQWLYCRLPTSSFFAHTESMDERVADYFESIFISYDKFREAMLPLKKKLENTKTLSIKGEQTDLLLKLGKASVYCSVGRHNLPDGEIFTAPEKYGIEGEVHINTPSTYLGNYFKEIHLTFKAGKVVDVYSSKNKLLNEILDSDEGARYCGEFAFGLNPLITGPINDILYDEKMAGSFHLALGNAYPEADNGNRSVIHWDLIQNMKNQKTKIFCDHEVIMEEGLFVTSELEHLNPEMLIPTIRRI
jgi:aminopeptidase